ncbi:MAG: hypothetical protein M3P01_07100 [Actinomycetota bacterium]|nr:hypothetical protein [Actinomycetota bacterium]
MIDTESARGGNGARRSWGSAAGTSVVVLGVSILAFMVIPNELIAFLSTRVEPTARDLLVSFWWVLALVACIWLFVRVQDQERRHGV